MGLAHNTDSKIYDYPKIQTFILSVPHRSQLMFLLQHTKLLKINYLLSTLTDTMLSVRVTYTDVAQIERFQT